MRFKYLCRNIMRRLSAFAIFAAALTAEGYAQNCGKNMKFNSDGEFKILQLTDLHLTPGKPEEAVKTFARIDFLVRNERPDFIAVTGDVVTDRKARGMWVSFLEHLDSCGVPYGVVFGNHDREQDLDARQISELVASARGSVNLLDADGELADLRLQLMPSKAGKGAAAEIFLMDSNEYSTIKGVDGYGWFRSSQVEWLREECGRSLQENGRHVPSVLFCHIPLNEFREAWEIKGFETMGTRAEKECSPALNSGIFHCMVETGNVFAVFCGHDHSNDYIARLHGIILGYGRYSGDDTVYNDLRHGARIIILQEGKRELRSYIREDDGSIAFDCRSWKDL